MSDWDDVRGRTQGAGLKVDFPVRRFEMISPLSDGGSGNAYQLVWGHAQPAEGEEPDDDSYIRTLETFTVYSVDGDFGGTGDKGLAYWAFDAQRWEILKMRSRCPRITFKASGAFTASNATLDNCEVLSTRGGRIAGAETSHTVTVTNQLGWAGDETGIGYAEWDDEANDGAGAWLIYDYTCPPEATS